MSIASRKFIVLFLLIQFSIGCLAKKRVAGLVIYRQSDRGIEYLMLKPSKKGKDWSPPKGRIDDGEDDITAALRETREEVGYTSDDLELYREQRYSVDQKKKNGKKSKRVTYFLAKLIATGKVPVLSHEHKEYRWLNRDQASSRYGSDGLFADMFNQFDYNINNHLLV